MSDQALLPSSHADWLKSILADHHATVGVSPAFNGVCTSDSPLVYGQFVRAVGSATQIEEGGHVEPCGEWAMPQGIATTEIHADQTVTIIVGPWRRPYSWLERTGSHDSLEV
jgi:hypothetical protein